MDLYDSVKFSLQDMVARFQAARGDGTITIAEGVQLLTHAVGHLVRVVESLGGTGAQKKDAVVRAAQRFYDEVLAPLDLPFVPNLLERTVVDPLIGRAVPVVVGGLIDGIVDFFNTSGWPSSPGVPELPPPPSGNPAPEVPGQATPPPGWKPY